MEQNMRCGLVLGLLALLKISDWAVKYAAFEGIFLFLLHIGIVIFKYFYVPTNIEHRGLQGLDF